MKYLPNATCFLSTTYHYLKKLQETKTIKCEYCNGYVVPSDETFLCLSGCGHVKGKQQSSEKEDG